MESDNYSLNTRMVQFPSAYFCAIFLACFVTLWQIRCCGYLQLDLSWTYSRNQNVISGRAISTWQYRVLSNWLYYGFINIFQSAGFENAKYEAVCIFRLFQNIIIFTLSVLYCRKLGLNNALITIGLSVLSFGMLHTLYRADISFDTYSDVIFYISAATLILYKKIYWLLILMPLAALNRETSGLIPVMMMGSVVVAGKYRNRNRDILLSCIALLFYLIIFIATRYYYGARGGMIGYSIFSWNIIKNNFMNEQTWIQLFVTMGIIPILAACSLRVSPKSLQTFFWSMVPMWFFIHFVSAVVAETRLFLVPMVVVLIPCMLFGISAILSNYRYIDS